ncbi:uncharacterized protein K489DRAFT_410845 [Dissoconium aciculare CBS 342.82]|jgi:hypothetical protein|uniref:BTB domain-containing protein n=1 Tax=Dissoconium aciculare CBS 342.82 TaxID=1314786 RepID=A0A6J3M0B2_9PEZI|nr:uncharacterized protein K489DRAFT_410845 [Dissoconium aciculare CBS 342.82]KAF1821358.1 hypothetical protein K489DRAFT_410845 [Dissoconium aciculare CBS 342.82]
MSYEHGCHLHNKQEPDVFGLKYDDNINGSEGPSADHPDMVSPMIGFVYFADYALVEPNDKLSRHAEPEHDWQSHVSRKESPEIKRILAEEVSQQEWIGVKFYLAAENHLTTHARVYALACEYFVSALRSATLTKFIQCVKDTAINVEGLAMAIKIAHCTAAGERNSGLRDCIFDYLSTHSSVLLDSVAIRDAINAVDGLTMQLLIKQSQCR